MTSPGGTHRGPRRTDGRLGALLEAGHFVVTGEVVPAATADPALVRRSAADLVGVVDAANVTDNHRARMRMSPVAASALLLEVGLEPVMQLTARDRNRLALGADLMGGHALGVRTVLCLSGDPMSVGPYPVEAEVRDLDAIRLIALAADLGAGRAPDGSAIEPALPMLLGAAESPAADASHGARLAEKAAAGARFAQTQPVFDLEQFRGWLERLGELGVLDKVAVIAGVMPARSAAQLERLAALPSWRVPDAVVDRLRVAADPPAEGVAIAVELVGQLRAVPGVRGVHVMGVGHEEAVPEVIRRAGLLPRPG